MFSRQLSVMLFPFYKQIGAGVLTPSRLIAAFREAGISAIEPMLSRTNSEPDKWESFHKTAIDAGMDYSCCDIAVNLIGENDTDLAVTLDKVVSDIEFCKVNMNCPVVLLYGTKPAPGMTNEDARKLYGEQVAKVVDRTKNCDVTITIEDFGIYPYFSAGGTHCLEILESANCPDVKFTFDNGNFLFAGDKPSRVYDMLKERIVHVHIKDLVLCQSEGQPMPASLTGKEHKTCLIGEGEAEVADTISLLKENGYGNYLSLEVSAADPLGEVIHGAKFVREVWGKDC